MVPVVGDKILVMSPMGVVQGVGGVEMEMIGEGELRTLN